MRLVSSLLLATSLLILNTMTTHAADPTPTSLFDFKVNSLDGQPVDLGQYKGHVVLVINTASKCGFTPQYAGLEKLSKEYQDKGVVLIGFPCNDFGQQEPGTATQIGEFCKKNYGVTFPMMEKVDVKGPNKAPVYVFLTTGFPEPTWNFCKYLVGKDGKVIKEFPSKVTPESPELHNAIDAALKS